MQQSDRTPRAWGLHQFGVSGQEFAVQNFSQGHIGGVVARNGRAKFEGTSHQRKCWVPIDVNLLEIVNGNRKAVQGDRSGQPPLA